MPGHVLIFDPMVTNRIMLKAQLVQDFFDVSLAADKKEFFNALRQRAPDVVLVSYTSERLAGFDNIQKLRQTPNLSHIQ